MTTTLYLRDHRKALVDAWSQAFEPYEEVVVELADFFVEPADALLSPANSFGIMDGGLDLAIRDRLGRVVQTRAQQAIVERHHGELPVGAAEIVATDHEQWPFLVVAPTMRVPETVAGTLNAYLAFRAALLAVEQHNRVEHAHPIASWVVPGLCTGIGGMDPRRCAAQMRLAYDQVRSPPRIPSFATIHLLHEKLRSAI
jgi:O-acetyl-ADP-ribose deacetylase (regulator of RNase III)